MSEDIRVLYNDFYFHNLDVIGLQLCALTIPEEFIAIMYTNFFQNYTTKRLIDFKFKEACENFYKHDDVEGYACIFGQFNDFFHYISEIYTNEINMPFICGYFIDNIIKQNEYRKNSFTIDRDNAIKKAQDNYLLSLLFNLGNIKIKKFMEVLDTTIKDKDIIDEFLNEYTEINREQRVIKLKTSVLEKIKKNLEASEKVGNSKGIPNSFLLWFDSRRYSTVYSDYLYGKTNPCHIFKFSDACTKYMKELRKTLPLSGPFFKRVLEAIEKDSFAIFHLKEYNSGMFYAYLIYLSEETDSSKVLHIINLWYSIFEQYPLKEDLLSDDFKGFRFKLETIEKKYSKVDMHQEELKAAENIIGEDIKSKKKKSKANKLKKQMKKKELEYLAKTQKFLQQYNGKMEDIAAEIQGQDNENVVCVICTSPITAEDNGVLFGFCSHSNVYIHVTSRYSR